MKPKLRRCYDVFLMSLCWLGRKWKKDFLIKENILKCSWTKETIAFSRCSLSFCFSLFFQWTSGVALSNLREVDGREDLYSQQLNRPICSRIFQGFFLHKTYLWSPGTFPKTNQFKNIFTYQKLVLTDQFWDTFCTNSILAEIWSK